MNKPIISLIAAISENRVIGNNGEIPWNIPGEQKRFKEITTPHPIIMGRKTYESIGRLLPNRANIIVTRDKELRIVGAIICHSLQEAIKKASELELSRLSVIAGGARQSLTNDDQNKIVSSSHHDGTPCNDTSSEIFIIGGGKLFEEAINIADKLYLTVIHKEYEGDAYFPEYSDFTREVFREEKEVGVYRFSYLDLVKR